MTLPWIQRFGAADDAADAPSTQWLGAKGASLLRMTRLGLPVPAGLTVLGHACADYHTNGQTLNPALLDAVDQGLADVESATGKTLGGSNPLLISIRSGAVDEMPGMLDPVLNIGMSPQVAKALAPTLADPLDAWRMWVDFVSLYGDVVLGVHYSRFSRAEDKYLAGRSREDLDETGLAELADALMAATAELGQPFPTDARAQIHRALEAAFDRFNSHRARYYRKTLGLSDDTGTAVNLQAMVYGNRADTDGAGVFCTRDARTGARGLTGTWVRQRQGTDHGLRDVEQEQSETLRQSAPEAWTALDAAAKTLEADARDAVELTFTVDQGDLWLLQCRNAPRTSHAAVQIAVELVEEGVIDHKTALGRLAPERLEALLRPVLHPDATRKVIAKGLDASPGAACGKVVFEAHECREHHERDEPTILVRLDTAPEDIQGMGVAAGVLTARGGQTSHAAVVTRGMGKPCVVGCTAIQVDYARELFYAGDTVVRKGDWITIDGSTGEVMQGQVEMLAPQADGGAMSTLLEWADQHATLKVRVNADTAADASKGIRLGAVGVGLCRTEHMFFQPDALRAIRRMILADDPRSRQRALNDILPIQRALFVDLFEAMQGRPVTVRLLDPPLHEFLPEREADISEVAEDLGVRGSALKARIDQLHEANPMMGHRGVRVGITSPEVYRTQVRALFEAACEVERQGIDVQPEILIPLVGDPRELEVVRDLVHEAASEVIAETGTNPSYAVGVMIELPRACLLADKLAPGCDFFSFGTNDLTQLTYGFSRDDMGKFFASYQREGVMPESPLAIFDVDGVGELVRVAAERGRAAQAGLPLGVCGEHGGDPRGVTFFHQIGVDYVSCSAYRVPVARLAAAQAALADSE